MEDLPNSSGIYQIVNLVTEQRYIGYSNNIKHRRNQHVSDLDKKVHKSSYLQNAWTNYGRANFSFRVLQLCNEEDLPLYEDYWVKVLKTEDRYYGYNLKPTDPNGRSNHSIETREKLSKANKGKKCPWVSERNKGSKMSDNHKFKLQSIFRTLDYKEIHRNTKGKKVMNTETGEIYRSLADLSDLINVPKYELSRRLSGVRKNNTIYKYL